MDNFKPVQAQNFSLSGAGAVIGNTSITLQSFTTIDGALLTMTNFGTLGFATIEPGNGTLEEQISFTGVTQNTNGTATLTGVSSVAFVDPYTATSGLLKTHAGNTSLVISNTAGFYDQFLRKNDDATIGATYTFTTPNYPQVDVSATFPTLPAQLATKAYADSLAIAGAPNATTSIQGLVQLATQAQVDAKTTTGSTGASLEITPDKVRSTLLSDYVADTGAANAYVITPSPAITAYTAGQIFSFKAANANTTASTLNVNGIGAKTIKKLTSADLVANDITVGQLVAVEYDGTNFQLISTPSKIATATLDAGTSANQIVQLNASAQLPAVSGALLTNVAVFKVGISSRGGNAASGSQTIAHGLGKTPTFVSITATYGLTTTNTSASTYGSIGTFDGTHTATLVYPFGASNGQTSAPSADTTNMVSVNFIGNGSGQTTQVATIAVDATNITLTWTYNSGGGITGTINLLWEAKA